MDKIAMIKLVRTITVEPGDLYETAPFQCNCCGTCKPARSALGLKKAKEIIDTLETHGCFS